MVNKKLNGKEEAVCLFDSQGFHLWQAYVLGIHKGHLKKATGAMVKVLTTFYGEERPVKILLAANGAEEKAVQKVAAELQIEQLRMWVLDHKSPKDVFKLFGLNDLPSMEEWKAYGKG